MRAVLLASLIALLMAGVASPGTQRTRDFFDQANAICNEENGKIHDLPNAKTRNQKLATLYAIALITRRLGIRLKALTPPSDYRKVFTSMANHFLQVALLTSKVRNEMIAHQEVSKTVAQLEAVAKAGEKEALILGLDGCGA